MRLKLKRVYEKASPDDGARFLVERLWPRGIRKEDLRMDGWVKEAGPSNDLRKWFAHDPAKWDEFRRRYAAELNTRREVWEPILQAAKTQTVTLLYSSHDAEHNNAVALQRYLEGKRVGGGARPKRSAAHAATRHASARHSVARKEHASPR